MAKYAKIAGIYPVFWKNKDGSKVQKFRVKKAVNKRVLDELFDTHDQAKKAIENFILPAYQQQLIEREAQAKKDQFSPDLESIFKTYLEKFSKEKSAKTHKLETMYFTKIFPETMLYDAPILSQNDYARVRINADENRLLRFGDLRESQVKTVHIERYILQRLSENVQESTIRRELSSLSAFFAKIPVLLSARSEYNANPFIGLVKSNFLHKKIKMRMRRLTNIEESQLSKSLKSCRSTRLLLTINLALSTGLRQGEMLSIKTAQIDFKNRTICIPKSDTKNNEIHYVPLTLEVENIVLKLQELNSNKCENSKLVGYTKEGLKSVWQRVLKRAKIEDFTWHDLRHEFISRLAESGHNLYEVKALSNSLHVKHLEKKLDPVRRAKTAQRLAQGGRMQDGDFKAVMNHSDAKMTAGYANVSAVELTKNQEMEAMRQQIEELKNMVQTLTKKESQNVSKTTAKN